jgi:hypothetical protein
MPGNKPDPAELWVWAINRGMYLETKRAANDIDSIMTRAGVKYRAIDARTYKTIEASGKWYAGETQALQAAWNTENENTA